MRSKESISIPATSPILSRSGAYSKAHASFQQPKLLSKPSATSRYGSSSNNATIRSKGSGSTSYGTAVTPSSRNHEQHHSFRACMVSSSGVMSNKLSASQVATSHRSASREAVANASFVSASRKTSTMGGNKH